MAKDNNLNRLKQAQQARREMLAQYRESQMHELKLPSGMIFIVKDVTMTDLLLTGRLPDTLLDMSDVAAQQGKSNIDLKQVSKNGADFKVLLDVLVRLCVLEPPIAEQGDEEHIGIDEINGDDKMAIFNWVNREVEQARPFREGEAEPVATLQPSHGLSVATEHPNGTGD